MDIAASARKHGVTDDGMLTHCETIGEHFETDDPDVAMFIGPSTSAAPLEVGVVTDAEGVAIIHSMPARQKLLTGWWTS